jgi:hypothetical protein
MAKTNLGLLAVHNIRENGVRYTDKLGGIPCPSMAIVRNDTGMSGFGEITLLANPALINPRKVAVFDADVNSSRVPSSFFKVDNKKLNKKIEDMLVDYPQLDDASLGSYMHHEFKTRGFREIASSTGESTYLLALSFAREIGYSPKIPMKIKESRIELMSSVKIRNWLGKNHDVDVCLDDKKAKQFCDLILDEIKNIVNEEMEWNEKRLRRSSNGNSNLFQALKKSSDEKAEKLISKYISNENGRTYPNPHFFMLMRNEYQKIKSGNNKVVDHVRLSSYIDRIVSKNKEKYISWLDKNFSSVINGEYFRAESRNENGYVVKELSLQNLVKEMSRGIRDSEGFNYGAGNIRSLMSKQFRTYDQIENSINKITNQDNFDVIKEQLNSRVIEVANELKDHLTYKRSSFDVIDAFCNATKDYIKMGKRGWLYYYNESSLEHLHTVDEMLNEIRQAPTTYFEAKFKSAVPLSSFEVAIVPTDISKDVLKILVDNGLKITKYEKHNENDRIAAINCHQDLMFGLNGQTEIPDRVYTGRSRKKNAESELSI